jgi:hypothetical protein
VMLYLAAKLSHVVVDVDRLACSLHRPTVYNCQRGGKCCQTGVVLPHHTAEGGSPFPGCVKPPGLDICHGVDRSGTCETKSYMEIMRVPLVDLLCQTVMGWIPALEYQPPSTHGACGHVLSCQAANATTS